MRARTSILFLWGLLILLPRLQAGDEDWLIVPGKSVGKIVIGMPQAEVFRLLGTPTMQNDFERTDRHAVYVGDGRSGDVPVAEGVTQSDWTTPLPLPGREDIIGYLCDFVTVYVRDTKVVQIEIRVRRFHDAHGLSIASTGADWRRRHGHTETFFCKYAHPSAGGLPAAKHFVFYEDAVPDGIGWRTAGFGNLSPDPEPDGEVDTVMVHAPGTKLFPDPDGGSRFIWKDRPGRTPGN